MHWINNWLPFSVTSSPYVQAKIIDKKTKEQIRIGKTGTELGKTNKQRQDRIGKKNAFELYVHNSGFLTQR